MHVKSGKRGLGVLDYLRMMTRRRAACHTAANEIYSLLLPPAPAAYRLTKRAAAGAKCCLRPAAVFLAVFSPCCAMC